MSARVRPALALASLATFLLAALSTLACVRFHRVRSAGMEPALPQGGVALSCACGPRAERGDVVVFRLPVDGGERGFAKRLIARGGDRVEVRGATLLVNGLAQEDRTRAPEAVNPAAASPAKTEGQDLRRDLDADRRLDVPPGFVFLLGDRKELSEDSRSFGAVPEGVVLSRVLLVFGRGADGLPYVRRVR